MDDRDDAIYWHGYKHGLKEANEIWVGVINESELHQQHRELIFERANRELGFRGSSEVRQVDE